MDLFLLIPIAGWGWGGGLYYFNETGIKYLCYAGCCFIKYATSEEADQAIRALHNQHTLPGVSCCASES